MASLPSRANQSAKVGCLSLEVDRVEKRGTLARAVAVPICRENVNNRASLQATHARSHTDCTRTHCDLAHTPAFPPPQQTERSPHLVPVPDFPSSQCASPSSLERIRTYQLLRTTPPPPPLPLVFSPQTPKSQTSNTTRRLSLTSNFISLTHLFPCFPSLLSPSAFSRTKPFSSSLFTMTTEVSIIPLHSPPPLPLPLPLFSVLRPRDLVVSSPDFAFVLSSCPVCAATHTDTRTRSTQHNPSSNKASPP